MRLLASSLLLLLLLLVPFSAQAQIDLSWHDCITQPSQAAKVNYACDGSRNGAPYRIVMSFRTPYELPKFVGFQAMIQILTSEPILPDFWRMAIGECRDGSIQFPTSLDSVGTGTAGACQNPFAGAVTGGGFQYTSGYPAAYYGQLLFAFARMDSIPLHTGQDYVAGAFTLDMDTHAGICAGCSVEACLSLDRIELYQIAETPPLDIVILNTSYRRQQVYWQQSGVITPMCSVPVRNTTWGAVKATYR